MAKFIQTISYSSTRGDEIRALGEQFRDQRMAAVDGPKPLSVTVCEDRDNPGHYTTIAVFASYEEAMANSNRPETGEFAQQMQKLCDGPPTFANLNVVDEFSP